MSDVGKPRGFKIAFSNDDLRRLQTRLDDTELPTEEIVPNADWRYGSNLAKLRQLVEDWKSGSPLGVDGQAVCLPHGVTAWWRNVETRLNKYPHFMVEIEGVQVHYQYAQSPDPNAIPLIFSHGWPGSFFEAHLLLDELMHKDRQGPSFHVVVPSLIGYGFSGPPPREKWTLQDTARLFDALMTKVLGYHAYFAQGGDWGHVVTRYLSLHEGCKILHTNFVIPSIPSYAFPLLAIGKAGYSNVFNKILSLVFDEFEQQGIKRGLEYVTTGNAYYLLNSTKPSTQGYGMYQSPVGILSYLLDKFQAWTDPKSPAFQTPGQGTTTSGMTDEALLINTSLYYLTKTFHTSLLPYYESNGSFDTLARNSTLTAPAAHKPFGFSAFPYELATSPKAWIARNNVNLVFYKRHTFGGHFAALEAPRELADDLREFAAAHWTA